MSILLECRIRVRKQFILIDRFVTIVPGDPQKVSVISVNSTAIRVEWKPPAEKEQYGIIRGYQIHVQEVDQKVVYFEN